MNTSFESRANSPNIYKIRFMPSELTNLYQEILSNVNTGEVYESLCKYVTTNIEPVGWRALWRTHNFNGLSISYDFEVEVMDVLHNSLEAIAVALTLIHPNESQLTAEQFDEKEKLLKEIKIINIPLTQLYVISDNDSDEQYHRTALIVEQIRFFYRNLWRPWDELANSDGSRNEIFVDTKLQPRLELYFDMENKLISQSTINKINHLLSEAWIIKNKIESIDTTNGFDAEDTTDAEDYINESDLMVALRLKLRLDDIEREMKLLEDKHMRIIASTLKMSGTENDYSNGDENCENKIHLIAKTFTLKMVNQCLEKLSKTNESEIAIIFHNSIANAFGSAKSGDKIYIMPGIYSCPTLPWLEKDIEINGFRESNEQIVLQSNDSSGDIFLNCNSNKLLFSDITLRATSEMQCLVMIHSGFVAFNNCVLDGTNCAKNTLIVLSKAKVEIDKCEIRNETGDGIVSRKGSLIVNKSVDFNTNTMQNNSEKKQIQYQLIESPSAPQLGAD